MKTSVAEYFQREAQAEYKSEYHNGEIIAMAGASKNHNIIVSNLLAELVFCLKKKNCQVYPSDMLLRLEKCDKYVYPDIMIACENEHNEEHAGLGVLLNPVVIIEVLSPSTSKYDQSEKMRCYLELDSLEEYIMVDSTSINISRYTKKEKGWFFEIFKDIQEKINLYNCAIDLQDIYRNVAF